MPVVALLLVAFAGCAEEGTPAGGEEGTEPPEVQATSDTGGIRGVVVDQAIVPVAGATVRILNEDLSAETDANGLFTFSGLDPGTYFVQATHPFYDSQQSSVDVVAGEERPPAVKIQLTRLISQNPYMTTLSFSGYIFCSANVPVGYSEECGEGVGIPGSGQRIGKNPSNKPEQEWYVDSDLVATMIMEQVWEPSVQLSADNSGQFRTFVGVNWICDPFCGDDYRFGVAVGSSPLLFRADMAEHEGLEYDTETRFTSFTYAADNPGVLLEQPYEEFVTISYVLPMPEDWSFVEGDANPFA